MRQPPSLRQNILWVVIARFGAQASMVLFTMLIARRLGSAGFGEFAFISAVIYLGNALTTFGTDMLLIREIAGQDDSSKLPAALAIQFVLSVLFIIMVITGSSLLPNQSPEAEAGLKVYSFSLLPLAFFGIFTILLRGKQRMDAYMLLNLTASLLQVTVVGLFFHSGGDLIALTRLLLVAQIGAAMIGAGICLRLFPGVWHAWHFSLPDLWNLTRLSAPIALIALVGISYQKISIYMLSVLEGPSTTGWFSASLRVLEASKIIHLAVFTSLYPAMAQAAQPLSDALPPAVRYLQRAFRRSLSLLLAVSAILALAVSFLAEPLIELLYGRVFAPAVPALRILIWILLPFTINTYCSLSIMAERGERKVICIQLAGLALLGGLNAWWIPKWGLIGTCQALLLAEVAQAAIYLAVRAHRQDRAHPWIIAASRPRTGD